MNHKILLIHLQISYLIRTKRFRPNRGLSHLSNSAQESYRIHDHLAFERLTTAFKGLVPAFDLFHGFPSYLGFFSFCVSFVLLSLSISPSHEILMSSHTLPWTAS